MNVPQTSNPLKLKYDFSNNNSNNNISYYRLHPDQLVKSMRQVLLSPHFQDEAEAQDGNITCPKVSQLARDRTRI